LVRTQTAEDWREAVRLTEQLAGPNLCPGSLVCFQPRCLAQSHSALHVLLTRRVWFAIKPVAMLYLKSLIATRAWEKVKTVSASAMGLHGQTPQLITCRGQCLLYTGQVRAASIPNLVHGYNSS
jgi:hypothetical protein